MNAHPDTTNANRLKTSVFNIVIPIRDGRALIYNTMSKQLVRLGAKTVDYYNEAGAGAVQVGDERVADLVKFGLVLPADHDEKAAAQAHFEAVRTKPNHMLMVIAPTMGCNFGCDYCYQGLDKSNKKMDDRVRASVMNLLKSKYKDAKSCTVMWYGGEPLNDKRSVLDLSERLYDYCTAKDIRLELQMVSNGYLLDPETVRRLQARNFKWVQITLDGPKEIHDTRRALLSGRGTYERIMENISYMVNNTEVFVHVRCNLDVRNMDYGFDLVDDMHARGLSHKRLSVYWAQVHSSTRDWRDGEGVVAEKQAYADREIELMRYAASRGLYHFSDLPRNQSLCVGTALHGYTIGPTGDFHNCFETVQNADQRIGHIDDIEAALASDMAQPWQVWSPYDSPTCSQCKLLPACGGMCANKFIGKDDQTGAASMLPCPSMKFNAAERIFELAKKQELVTQDDWLPHKSRTTTAMVGEIYTEERLDEAIAIMNQNVAERSKKAIKVHGEGVVIDTDAGLTQQQDTAQQDTAQAAPVNAPEPELKTERKNGKAKPAGKAKASCKASAKPPNKSVTLIGPEGKKTNTRTPVPAE